jgi:nitrite reductase (NADH) small subunit
MPDEYNLGPLSRIPPGEGKAFALGGCEVAVFRTRGGAVHATEARCPHRGGPLADGMLGGGVLVCPLHAMKFEIASGAAMGQGCAPVRVYPVRVSAEGEIFLQLSDPRNQ